MPADFLSRNLVVDSISFDEDRIRDEQMLDPRLVALKKLLYSNTLPQYNTEDFRFCKLYQNDSLLSRQRNPVQKTPPDWRTRPSGVVCTSNDERRHFARSSWCRTIRTWRNLEDERTDSPKLLLARNGSRYHDAFENLPEVSATSNERPNETSTAVTFTAVYSTKSKNSC